MISYEIKKTNSLRQEVKRYINGIEEMKAEREHLLARYSIALNSDNTNLMQNILLKLSANTLLADAYKVGLKSLQMEIGG